MTPWLDGVGSALSEPLPYLILGLIGFAVFFGILERLDGTHKKDAFGRPARKPYDPFAAGNIYNPKGSLTEDEIAHKRAARLQQDEANRKFQEQMAQKREWERKSLNPTPAEIEAAPAEKARLDQGYAAGAQARSERRVRQKEDRRAAGLCVDCAAPFEREPDVLGYPPVRCAGCWEAQRTRQQARK